jgi:hypothetical protein
MGSGFLIGLASGLLTCGSLCTASDLNNPFRVEAHGQPIDMELGNAAPFATDFDGDGVFDLMLGQRGACKLRIYRNEGSNTDPKFGVSAFFRAAGQDASLPGG